MREVTLDELKTLTENARESLWDIAKPYGRDPKIYLHWSAGHYGQFYDDYHVNIDSDGSYYLSTDDLTDVLAHTYHRNSGAIGLSMAACAFSSSDGLGDEPPTAEQIEAMAKLMAVMSQALCITCDKDHVMTHGEAGDNEDGITHLHEPYGPKSTCERWDLEFLGTDESPSFNPYATDGSRGGDVLRGKAQWYIDEGKV